MSKKQANKPTRTVSAPSSVVSTFRTPDFIKNVPLQSLLIFVFAFLLYANTLTHGFVLDDAIVITDNMFTQQGVNGIGGILSKDTFFGFFKVEGKEALVSGGRYRPMTLVIFALIYQVAGASPFVFHLLTIILFAATCVLLYRLLLMLFGTENEHSSLLAWVSALLFAAHPIHTEVVANIKGCDEIVTLLGSLGTLCLILKSFDSGESKWNILAGIVFFLTCLSKENAAAFVVVVPLALWFFRNPGNDGKPSVLKASVPVFVAFLAFFIVRGTILHWRFGGAPMELMNNPFLKIEGTQWVPFSPAEKLATIFYTLWRYIQLLFVPAILTHDYYPRQIGLITFSNPTAVLGLLFHAGLLWYAIRGTRKRDPLAFGIWAYLLPLSIVSNFVFPIGTNMGERFVFMPSAGFCLTAALLLTRASRNNSVVLYTILGIVIAFFSLKTVTRNPAWASNEILFFSDAETSKNSAKLQNACGGILFDKATQEKDPEIQKELCKRALVHLDRAVNIYPNYKDAYISRAGCYYVLKNYENAIADYKVALRFAADDAKLKTYLAMSLREGGKYQGEQKRDLAKALEYLNESWQVNQQDPETARLLGVANGIKGNREEALKWFSKAVELAPDSASYLYDLGQAYSAVGNEAKGQELRKSALELDPKLLENRGLK
jgi:hypothetical protein